MNYMKLFWTFLICLLCNFAHAETIGWRHLKWNKLKIEVCWANSDFPENQYNESQLINMKRAHLLENLFILDDDRKKFIQEAIEAEYTLERTGIHFVGWQSCLDRTSWDVAIIIGNQIKKRNGSASLGQGGINADTYSTSHPGDLKGYVFLNINKTNITQKALALPGEKSLLSYQDHIKSTALHEFDIYPV